MQVLLILSLSILCVFFLITLINIFFGPHLRRLKQPVDKPLVSVLIPARNEADTISRCLDSILQQDYPNLEIKVLDDNSTDHTAEILRNYSEKFPQIIAITGEALPPDWLGKNWACWQLSQHAKGEIFIFADADTWHEKTAATATVGWMEKYGLSLFSAFPQQITRSFSEKIIIPLIDMILYMLLPLWSVNKFRTAALSAANGQWLAIRKADYERIGGHRSLKERVVEDVEMARLCKKTGLSIMTSSGTGMVYCRMYHNLCGIWAGLSKNFYGLTGNNFFVLVLFMIFMSSAFLLPIAALVFNIYEEILWIVFLMMFLLRTMLALAFKHNIIIGIIFLPLTIIIGMIVAVNSFFQYRFGSVLWKDRKINLK